MAEKSLTLRVGAKGVTATESALNRINKQIGAGSPLGKLGGAALGTGIVAGLTFIGRALEGATGRAEELVTQFRLGKISAEEMAAEVAKSLPILGSLITAGRNIRELITGEKAEIEKINAEVAATNAFLDARAAAWQRATEAAKRHEEALKSIADRMAVIGLIDPQRTLALKGQALEAALAKIGAEADKRIAGEESAFAPQIKAAVSEVERLRKLIPAPQFAPGAGQKMRGLTTDPSIYGAGGIQVNKAEIQAATAALKAAQGREGALRAELSTSIDALRLQRAEQERMTTRLAVIEGFDKAIQSGRIWARAGAALADQVGRSLPRMWHELQAAVRQADRESREEARASFLRRRSRLHEEEHLRGLEETGRIREPERERGPMFSPITEERFTTGAGAAARERFGLGIDATTTAVRENTAETKRQTKIQEELRRTMEQVLEQIRNPQEIFGDI